MSEDVSSKQLALTSNDSAGADESCKDNEAWGPQSEEPTTFTVASDDQITAADGVAAARANLRPGDAAFAQQVLGVEHYCELAPDHEKQHVDIQRSIEDDLHSDTLFNDHADTYPEPEQHAQRTSHEPIKHDTTMEVMSYEQECAAPPITADVQRHSTPPEESSLFVPERDPASRSPVPHAVAPRSSIAPPQHTTTPVGQVKAPVKLSVFAKFREMQKVAQARKNAFSRYAATPQPGADDLDPESYLDAVTSVINPPAGAYAVQVDEAEMAHRRALAEFQRQKRHYDTIKGEYNGHLPFRQEIEWMKIVGAEEARLKKRQRELALAEEGEEQDIFPQVHFQSGEQVDESDHDFSGESSSRKRRRGDQPAEESVALTLQEAEYQSMRVALDAEDDSPKKKKKRKTDAADTEQGQTPRSSTKGKTSKSKATRPSRAKAAGTSAKRPRKTAKSKRELERATKQACSLFNADVFEQQAGADAAEQPTLREGNKLNALKELIASVPIQDKSQARSDMHTLLQASRDFDGVGACKIAPHGNWMVRGMRTSLKGYQVLGSAFMRRRENDAHEPKGGLMADQMGLGKTLMMLGKYIQPSPLVHSDSG